MFSPSKVIILLEFYPWTSDEGLSFSRGIPACLISTLPEPVFQRDCYLPLIPEGLTSYTLADEAHNAAETSVSLASSARRDVCLVHCFPFPNNWLFLRLRDQYHFITQTVEKFLIFGGWCRPKHKSV